MSTDIFARHWTRVAMAIGALAAVTAAPAARADDDIVIGTSLPFAGPMAEAGAALRDGYQLAIDGVNAKGGLTIAGKAHKVKLVVLDNQGDANQVSGQVKKLVQEDGAVALLGAVTPPFSVPGYIVADQLKKPIVATTCPVLACLGTRKGGYKYAWDMYAYEPTASEISWPAADLVQTNKKVAIFANTDDDGETWGKLWTEQAQKHGYQIVYWAKVPIGTTNFGSQIEEAKKSGAEIVLGQMIPPDAIALWKQMKALGYAPKIATCEKCGSGDWWPGALGPVADGTLTSDVWAPELGGPGTDIVMSGVGSKYHGKVLSSAALAYTAAYVVMDAITQAQSLDGAAINAAIAKTDKDYAVGRIKFAEDHGTRLVPTMEQWQNGALVRILPAGKGAVAIVAPAKGLQ